MADLSELKKTPTVVGESHQKLRSLLCNEDRDFLIRNNGEKVKVKDLEGKYVGLYCCSNFHDGVLFTAVLSEIYRRLLEKGDFEIVYIFERCKEKSFLGDHRTMKWLTLPFSDTNTRGNLTDIFQSCGIPWLVLIDKEGRIVTTEGVEIIQYFGVKAYPFTAERIDLLMAEKKALKASQTVESILVSDERDFVIAHGGRKVPVSELAGKTLGLYFSVHWFRACTEFTPKLVEIYNELSTKGEPFEIVFVNCDLNQESFEKFYASMPWLTLPFRDRFMSKLYRYFGVRSCDPGLVIIGPDGKTLQTNAVGLINQYGIRAYPFTEKRIKEIEAEDERSRQSLESLLVSDERDFVTKHGDEKVPVSELAGKTVALFFYFNCWYYSYSKRFTQRVLDAYDELKERGEPFEIVLIEADGRDFDIFEVENSRPMPWLCLPFEETKTEELNRLFRVQYDPKLVVFGPDGKLVTEFGGGAVSMLGARAYPFTDTHLEKEIEEVAQKSRQEMKIIGHTKRPLLLTRRGQAIFECRRCLLEGRGWSYHCDECGHDYHLSCEVEDDDEVGILEDDEAAAYDYLDQHKERPQQ